MPRAGSPRQTRPRSSKDDSPSRDCARGSSAGLNRLSSERAPRRFWSESTGDCRPPSAVRSALRTINAKTGFVSSRLAGRGRAVLSMNRRGSRAVKSVNWQKARRRIRHLDVQGDRRTLLSGRLTATEPGRVELAGAQLSHRDGLFLQPPAVQAQQRQPQFASGEVETDDAMVVDRYHRADAVGAGPVRRRPDPGGAAEVISHSG